MTEEELFAHICSMVSDKPKGRQPPFAEVAIPLHPDDPIDFEAVRDAACASVLGPSDFIYHPPLGVPHIDVYRYPATPSREFSCYVTNGMSDFPLQLPDGTYCRVEIMAAVSQQSLDIAEFSARSVASPILHGQLCPLLSHGPFPQGVLTKPFTYALLIPPFLASDLHVFPLTQDEPVTLLQVIGITAREREYAVAAGSRLLVEERLPDKLSTWLLNGRREGT